MGPHRKNTGTIRARAVLFAACALATALSSAPAMGKDYPPQVARGITVPVGFGVSLFAQTPGGYLPTSLTWAKVGAESAASRATADGLHHGVRLYVTAVSGNFFSGTNNGAVLAYEDEGGVPTTAATGLDQPLGIAVGNDGTLYVTETEPGIGRVTALNDADANGVFETKRTVIKNLPNGRHQTNGLTFGPDGMLYVANGNATDDGIECGPEPVVPIDCEFEEIKPWSGSIIRVNPSWTDVDLLKDIRIDADGTVAADGLDDESVLVSSGYRNIYDVDFDPRDPKSIWTPMNGPDDPSGSEPLFALDVTDQQVVGVDENGVPIRGPRIEDAGFPSCLYDPHDNHFPEPQVGGGHDHPGSPEPQDNPNEAVIARFGACNTGGVIRPKAIYAWGHEGTSGLAFERGTQFPGRYDGDLFTAEWGSIWNLNGLQPTGHKIIHMDVSDDRAVVAQKEFMTGVLPMDVTFGPTGTMFVADMTGQIYEVEHLSDAATPDVVNVDMRNGQFVPQAVTIVQGQTVRWCNADTTPHNVTAVQKAKLVDPIQGNSPLQSGVEMNSPGDVAPGACYSYTFASETSAYTYNSTTTATDAAAMRGTVTVLPVSR